MTPADLRARMAQAVTNHAPALIGLSHRIHDTPETGFQEHRASQWVGNALASIGMDVTPGPPSLPTSLIAQAGDGAHAIGLCAEYDSLPGMGHACGHNIIAAGAVAAATALMSVLHDADIRLRVVGTPAEENGGGKIALLKQGAFDGLEAVLMFHPAARDSIRPLMLASSPLTATYTGRAAHASAFPERGINAADAAVIAQTAIGLLRQQLEPSDRVHGVLVEGGRAANVIPDKTRYDLTVRAATTERLETLRGRIGACLEAGALATGCTLDLTELAPVYPEMRHDDHLARLFAANAARTGHTGQATPDTRPAASTDLGAVSQTIPAIHPLLKIDAGGYAPHEPQFAQYTDSPSADQLVLDGATALAYTALDLAEGAKPGPADTVW